VLKRRSTQAGRRAAERDCPARCAAREDDDRCPREGYHPRWVPEAGPGTRLTGDQAEVGGAVAGRDGVNAATEMMQTRRPHAGQAKQH